MSYPEPRMFVPDVSPVTNAKNKNRPVAQTASAGTYPSPNDPTFQTKNRDNDIPRWNEELNATEFVSDLYTTFCLRNTENSII
jgi:hypothetical protein